MQLVAGIVAGTEALSVGTFDNLESYTFISEPVREAHQRRREFSFLTHLQIWMAGNIMCDIIIVGSMAYFVSPFH